MFLFWSRYFSLAEEGISISRAFDMIQQNRLVYKTRLEKKWSFEMTKVRVYVSVAVLHLFPLKSCWDGLWKNVIRME